MLAELHRKGLVRHIGLSNATPTQIAEGRRICEIVCVQNHYNVAHRADDALIDDLAGDGIAYVPFFPLGGFRSPAVVRLVGHRSARWRHAKAGRSRLAARRAPNVLLIPGTSSPAHLRENLAVDELVLPDEAIAQLNAIGNKASAQ